MEARRGRFLSHSLSTPLLHLYPKPPLHSPKKLKMILVAEKLPLIGDMPLLGAMVAKRKVPICSLVQRPSSPRFAARHGIAPRNSSFLPLFRGGKGVQLLGRRTTPGCLGKFWNQISIFSKDRPFQKKGKEHEGKKMEPGNISAQEMGHKSLTV